MSDRSHWKRYGEGSGREGRGRGRGSRRGRSSAHGGGHGAHGGAQLSADEAMARRKARFSKEDEQIKRTQAKEYGLVSRGEDLRLQKDAGARDKYYDEVVAKVGKYDGTERQRDEILMDFRRLRESILRNEPDETTRKVLLASIRFSTSVGHYQSYVPAINEALRAKKVFSVAEVAEVSSYFALHVVHFGQEYEKGLEVCAAGRVPQCVEEIVQAYITGDYYGWMHRYADLAMQGTDSDTASRFPEHIRAGAQGVLRTTGYSTVLRRYTGEIGASYFQLQKIVLESMTACSYEFVAKIRPEWKPAGDDGQTIIIRERRR